MTGTLDTFIFLAMGVVLVVLLFGVGNMLMTGDKARSRSNKLMRLRVVAQFVAVALLMVGFWLKTRAA
jgi:TATA-box binding protein (TBP) (component of TFIID and TFIIIB)